MTPCKLDALEALRTTGEEFVVLARVSLRGAPLSQLQAFECSTSGGILSPVPRLPRLEGGKVAVPRRLRRQATPRKPDALEALRATGEEFVFLARLSLRGAPPSQIQAPECGSPGRILSAVQVFPGLEGGKFLLPGRGRGHRMILDRAVPSPHLSPFLWSCLRLTLHSRCSLGPFGEGTENEIGAELCASSPTK